MTSTTSTSIEIEELREAGEDGGDLMGYYARGHHAPEDFERAAGTKGAWKATVCASVEIHRTRKSRREIREYDRGYQEGLSRALGFLLAQLEWGGNLAEKATVEQRRAIAAELRDAFKRDHESMNKEQAS